MLERRGLRLDAVKPTEKSMKSIRELFTQFGYRAENPEVYNALTSYGALMLDGTNRKGLFLKGECGIGKSYGVEVLAAIFHLPVFRTEDFISAYKDLDGNLNELRKMVITGMDFFNAPHDIVLDDIGTADTARNYGEIADIVCNVIDWRYHAYLKYGVKTIVTTNLSDSEILQRYGRRVEDRIREVFYVKRVAGKSLR